MKEEWKDIPGYEGLYKVSSLGRVKSLNRIANRSCGMVQPVRERILKQSTRYKYKSVTMHDHNKYQRSWRVHQLVAMAFLNHNPCGFDMVVDHIDEDKHNNNLSNLRLVTNGENTTRNRNGKHSKYRGVTFNKSDSKWKAMIFIDGKIRTIGSFATEEEAGEAYKDISSGADINKYRQIFRSDHPGVSKFRGDKWRSRVTIDKKEYHVGIFNTKKEAVEARENFVKDFKLK